MRREIGIAGFDRAEWMPEAPDARVLCRYPTIGVVLQSTPPERQGCLEVRVPAFQDPCILYCNRSGGPVDANIAGSRRDIHPARGQFLIHPAFADSVWRRQRDPSDLVHLHLSSALVRAVRQDMPGGGGEDEANLPLVWPTADRTGEQMIGLILEESLRGGPTGRMYVESLATALVCRVVHLSDGQSEGNTRSYALAPARRRRVLDYIEANLTDDIGLEDLARVAGLSSWHLVRSFRKEMGMPPHRYLLQRRCELARGLLNDTDMSLKAVALACGFASTSHFTTVFQRIVGQPPGAWRRTAGTGTLVGAQQVAAATISNGA